MAFFRKRGGLRPPSSEPPGTGAHRRPGPGRAALLGALVLARLAAAEAPLVGFPPLEPAAAGASFRVQHGFTLDLLAAEPLVASPVAVTYDEDGNAYVVEMRDYPYTDRRTHQPWAENTTDAPLGRVRLLIDRDGDGRFDESHVFADGLSWPTGICCWKGGVFVTTTPDVLYLKDTDGDHRADVREQAFTGFRKFNVQAVINTPAWGLDNRITFAGSTNGGLIQSPRQPELAPLKLARGDLRFDPRTGGIEVIAGGARFGNSFDDWGNRFICGPSTPSLHVVFDGTGPRRNPFLPVPNPVHPVRALKELKPLHKISPPEPWRALRAEQWKKSNPTAPPSELMSGGAFTSASGLTLYRGAAYPREFHGQAFVAECANNLVQRQTVAPDGVTFALEAADAEAEFIASTDTWFRPVFLTNAPDGTLHLVDMYRETIEHPWSIPDDIHARVDLLSGRERGRIYRIAPPGFLAPPPPRLGRASTPELVAALEHPHAWWRETAQRLLVERADAAAVAPLRQRLASSPRPLGRLHALATLAGLGALTEADLGRALEDGSAGVREHAVRLAAARPEWPGLRGRLLRLAADSDLRVRYPLALAAAAADDSPALDAIATILVRDGGDRWVRAAALGVTPAQCVQLAERFLRTGEVSDAVLEPLLFVVGAENRREHLERVHAAFAAGRPDARRVDEFLGRIGAGLQHGGRSLRAAFASGSPAGRQVEERLAAAYRGVTDATQPAPERERALPLIAHDEFSRAGPALGALLDSREPREVQLAALRALARFPQAEVARLLIAGWSTFTPAVRDEVVGILVSRRDRAAALLDAMERNVIAPGSVSASRRTQLLALPDPALKVRAQKFFGETSANRREVVERYLAALELPAEPARGIAHFEAVCAGCHRFARRGTEIGPDLESVRGWDRGKLLLNILDPNREVAANYVAYVVELKDGTSLAGMIVDESSASIRLRRVGAPDETILRTNIVRITSAAASLMPDGLEAALPLQAMADLLAYLTSR